MTGPCNWSVTGCVCGSSCWDSHPPQVRAACEAAATFVMWSATGRKFGLCEVTEQPCRPQPPEPTYVAYPLSTPAVGPYIDSGQWRNCMCPGGSVCQCGPSQCDTVEVTGPTTRTGMTVSIDGVTLDQSAYRVIDGHTLIRTDGEQWPLCNDLSSQDPPAFVVTHLVGTEIPEALQYATDRLACEYAKACTGADCALPRQLRSLTRDGVELDVVDLPADSTMVRTGIPLVDDVIRALNPSGARRPASVWSPDLPAPTRVA